MFYFVYTNTMIWLQGAYSFIGSYGIKKILGKLSRPKNLSGHTKRHLKLWSHVAIAVIYLVAYSDISFLAYAMVQHWAKKYLYRFKHP
jgi:hypothetical protein